jgi:hypothetical protein
MPSRTVADVATWRPQPFGKRNHRHVDEPIVEPLWTGDRVLVHVAGEQVRIVDGAGEPLDGDDLDPIVAALVTGGRAESMVLDGYLTTQPTRESTGAYSLGIDPPTAQQMAGQLLFGARALRSSVSRPGDIGPSTEDAAGATPLGFVAVDLLAIDDEPLLEVPLLERKRILESAFEESLLLRRGVFVRPPVDTWLVSWRSLGFSHLAYKAANSRYTPGEPNDAWATVAIPNR